MPEQPESGTETVSDETAWIAAAIELLAVVSALIFAILQAR